MAEQLEAFGELGVELERSFERGDRLVETVRPDVRVCEVVVRPGTSRFVCHLLSEPHQRRIHPPQVFQVVSGFTICQGFINHLPLDLQYIADAIEYFSQLLVG